MEDKEQLQWDTVQEEQGEKEHCTKKGLSLKIEKPVEEPKESQPGEVLTPHCILLQFFPF